jgi:hypothetical protein
MATAAAYAEFAVRETREVPPAYERLSIAVCRDDEVLALLGLRCPRRRTGPRGTCLALDGTPLAWTRAHGQAITWFG